MTVQMDCGDDILDRSFEEDGDGEKSSKGHKLLMVRMREKVYPQVEDEAKAMYSEFHTVGSKFSRQPTEPMIGFCQRRTRAYNSCENWTQNERI